MHPHLTTTRTSYAVMCAGCTDVHLLDHRKGTDDWFCATCANQRAAAFRPVVGGLVRLVDDPFPSDYTVLAIDGDTVTLRRQGFPADHNLGRPFTCHRGHLDPIRSPQAHISRGPQTETPHRPPQEEPVDAETPAALLRRAAAHLRATQRAAYDAPLADWLEDCAQGAEKLLLPLRYHRALMVALAALGESLDQTHPEGTR